ncbi:hypothetical protein FIBSPDRAFT_874332, partial [Athelia psychrophila]
HTQAPSETVPSTKVHEAPQQASTSPGDGAEVQDNTPEVADPHQTSFKDQVIGYAKITRGKSRRLLISLRPSKKASASSPVMPHCTSTPSQARRS